MLNRYSSNEVIDCEIRTQVKNSPFYCTIRLRESFIRTQSVCPTVAAHSPGHTFEAHILILDHQLVLWQQIINEYSIQAGKYSNAHFQRIWHGPYVWYGESYCLLCSLKYMLAFSNVLSSTYSLYKFKQLFLASSQCILFIYLFFSSYKASYKVFPSS